MENNCLSAEYEQKLINQAKQDEQAFRHLYDWYFPKIYQFLIKRTGHKETAEDIVSETFMKAFVNIEKFEYKGVTFGAWLYRIASNLVIDNYRKNKKLSDADIDELPQQSSDEDLQQNVINLENKQKIEKALKKLSGKEKQVIELKFYAQLTNIEIAQVTQLSVSNVGVIIYRALKKCQKLL